MAETPAVPRPAPDDTLQNESILDSEDFAEALSEIVNKYGINVTNNSPRWQDGVYLRHMGEFLGDVRDAAIRFPQKRRTQ